MRLASVMLCGLALAMPSPAFGQSRLVVIQAVTDGDTLRLTSGERVRLAGIDAPELAQVCRRWSGESWACGQEARRYLARLAAAGEVQCTIHGQDRYQRALGYCWAAGREFGGEMLRAGLAVPYEGGLWAWGQVLPAMIKQAGLWSGSFVWPATYRKQQK